MEKTKSILQNNLFLPELIDKVIKNYLRDQKNSKESQNKKEGWYFQLTYVGLFSRYTHSKIKGIIEKLCKDEVSVNLVFVPYKIGSMASAKDKIPSFVKSMVVYKFVCANCNACYEGETIRHLPTRIKKHLKTDKKVAYIPTFLIK